MKHSICYEIREGKNLLPMPYTEINFTYESYCFEIVCVLILCTEFREALSKREESKICSQLKIQYQNRTPNVCEKI